MPTGVAGTQARQYHSQQLHYFRKTVNYNDAGIGSGVQFGVFPKGAKIRDAMASVETGFNSAGTNRLVIGTNSTSFNNIMTSTVAAASTTGNKQSLVGGALAAFTQDTPVYVKYTAATGTAATAGKAVISVSYMPDNDK